MRCLLLILTLTEFVGAQPRASKLPGEDRSALEADCLDVLTASVRSRSPYDVPTALSEIAAIHDARASSLLKEALDSPASWIRAEALHVLDRSNAEKYFPIVKERLLKDPDFWVRVRAVQALEKVGGGQALQVFRLVSTDSDMRLRGIVFATMERMGASAVPALEELLLGSDEDSKETAAYVLGDIGDKRALPALRRTLSDPSPNVRLGVALSLAKMGDATAAPELIKQTLGSAKAKAQARLQAAVALYRLGDRSRAKIVYSALDGADPKLRDYAVNVLSSFGLGIQFASDLRKKAAGDPVTYVRLSAMEALERKGTASIDVLFRTLVRDKDEDVRLGAARWLAKRGDEESVHVLETGLTSTNIGTRQSTAEDLGRLGAKGAASALRAVLRDSNPFVVINAMKALVLLDDKAAIPSIRAIMTADAEPREVIEAAAAAIRKLSGGQALEIFRSTVQAKAAPVRIVSCGNVIRSLENTP